MELLVNLLAIAVLLFVAHRCYHAIRCWLAFNDERQALEARLKKLEERARLLSVQRMLIDETMEWLLDNLEGQIQASKNDDVVKALARHQMRQIRARDFIAGRASSLDGE